ncbi:MAG: GTP-binding protein, partial [Caldimonas sp.]
PWGSAPPSTKLVFIGRRLDRARLQEELQGCAAKAGVAA